MVRCHGGLSARVSLRRGWLFSAATRSWRLPNRMLAVCVPRCWLIARLAAAVARKALLRSLWTAWGDAPHWARATRAAGYGPGEMLFYSVVIVSTCYLLVCGWTAFAWRVGGAGSMLTW